MDINNKLHNCVKITDIINDVFRPKKTLKKTRIRLHNTPALPTLLYDSENQTIKPRDATRMSAPETK
jgi:hypothetical protein